MKQLLTSALFIVLASGLCGQANEHEVKTEIKTEAFTGINAQNDIHVYLIKGGENKVLISGDNTENVVVKNKKGELSVRMNTKNMFKGSQTTATVYYTEELEELYASTDAEIESEDVLEQKRLKVNCDSGGFIFLTVNIEDLEVVAASGGQVQATGSVQSQIVKINAGGQYNGLDLDSNYAEVSVTAGGSADVFVTKNLKASVSMGGSISYGGNPENVSEQTKLGGAITKLP